MNSRKILVTGGCGFIGSQFVKIMLEDDESIEIVNLDLLTYAGDPSNWWIPNRACTEAMLRSAGFTILSRPADEIYLCRRR